MGKLNKNFLNGAKLSITQSFNEREKKILAANLKFYPGYRLVPKELNML